MLRSSLQWPHFHLNMDLPIYTPTWHRVLLFGKKDPNPAGSHPVISKGLTRKKSVGAERAGST